MCFLFLPSVMVPDPVPVLFPFPFPASDQTWSRSLVPVLGPGPWSRSLSCHISGPDLGPGSGPVKFLISALVLNPVPVNISDPVTQCLYLNSHGVKIAYNIVGNFHTM